MPLKIHLSAVCIALVWFASALAPFGLAQQENSGNAENGKRLFIKNGCYECHGYVGQGGSAGARIAPWTFGASALTAYVRQPSGQMPPYTEKVMSNRELVDVAEYLKSIPEPKPAQRESAK